ncbi:ABC transporter permease [Haloferula sargassicola]|uniref:ABC-2 type transporter transmembrane domain-containing protein n=1 Tax=Haloferula sargassicola TaxID=490096 RepID=A0ABP9UJD1_9BACT
MFRPSTVQALVTRQVLLYTRNPVRAVELFFWPIVQLLVWGFVTMYLQQQAGSGGQDGFARMITFLIGAIILWDALFRSQQGVAISFLEDVWTRNLLNVFAAPIRMTEYLSATFVVGLLRVVITGVVLAAIAWISYQFNLFQFQWKLFAFYANLMIFGWTLGILSTALVLRWGHGVESLAWAIPFMIQPFACVFYEVNVLPGWMQWVALAMPPAHVFNGMRSMVATGTLNPGDLVLAGGLNVAYLAVAGLLFSRTLSVARERGLLVKTAAS